MAFINFVYPVRKDELLNVSSEQYYIKDVTTVKHIPDALSAAEELAKDEGHSFIVDNFEIFFSIIFHAENLGARTIEKSYNILNKAMKDLTQSLPLLLEDPELLKDDDDTKQKYQTIIKMLMYAYLETIKIIEKYFANIHTKIVLDNKGKKRLPKDGSANSYESYNRSDVLTILINVMRQDIYLIWEPGLIDEILISNTMNTCYSFLKEQHIKNDKKTLKDLWSFFGILIRSHNQNTSFVTRIVDAIKTCEHLKTVIPEGLHYLYQEYKCKSLITDLVREITEWQVEESDAQGSRLCSNVLASLATLMPDVMLAEIIYLTRYLCHDSYNLRIAVLSIITEILRLLLEKEELNDDEAEVKEELLRILEENVFDISGFVRSKVIGFWTRLQRENLIDMSCQIRVLKNVETLLTDKTSNTRKAAIELVTSFMEHNPFSPNLKSSTIVDELQTKIDKLRAQQNANRSDKEREWEEHEEGLREEIKRVLEEDKENCDISNEANIIEDGLLLREQIVNKNYKNVVKSFYAICSQREVDLNGDESAALNQLKLLFTTMNIILNTSQVAEEMMEVDKSTDAITQELNIAEDRLEFIKLINAATNKIKTLLSSRMIGEVQEASRYFVVAYEFQIEGIDNGIMLLIKMLNRPEKERVEIALSALQSIYLTSLGTENTNEHSLQVAARLINLVKNTCDKNISDVLSMISEWVNKGYIDNNIIEMFWQYFTKRIDVSDEDSVIALEILCMAACGRVSIATKNFRLVFSIAHGERAKNNARLAAAGCKFLSIAWTSPDQNAVKVDDGIWDTLIELMRSYVTMKIPNVNLFIENCVEMFFKVCKCPVPKVTKLLSVFIHEYAEPSQKDGKTPAYIYLRLIVLLEYTVLWHMFYLDSIVHPELKRRFEEKNKDKGGKRTSKRTMSSASTTNGDESIVDNLDDPDADFVVYLMDQHSVADTTELGQLASVFTCVFDNPEKCKSEILQAAAANALIKYMLISSKYCQKYIQWVFTILEITTSNRIKRNIITQCGDILERFPNIAEPYMPKLFKFFQDDDIKIRKNTLFLISNLIIRDMLRPYECVFEFARCLVDSNKEIVDIVQNFFTLLNQKPNVLLNSLPDIFGHLVNIETISDEQLQEIMKYLFGFIDKTKSTEKLVDRFVAKYTGLEDERIARHITFCLTLLTFNERALRILNDNFVNYRQFILVGDIFALFSQLIAEYKKPATRQTLKDLAEEFDENVSKMFQLTEGGERPTFAKPGKVARKKKKQTREESSESSEEEQKSTKKKRKQAERAKRKRNNKNVESDSDSEESSSKRRSRRGKGRRTTRQYSSSEEE